MKKSSIVVLIGGFILLTAFLGPISQEKMYKKQKNFQSTEEVIQVLNNYPILQKDGVRGETKETNEFNECLSVRKRLTNITDLNYAKIDVEEVVALDEKTKTDLLDYYGTLRKKNSKRLPINRQEAVRLKIKSYYFTNYITGEIESNGSDETLDLVLIDEGEGLVIDFENRFSSDYIPDYSAMNIDEIQNTRKGNYNEGIDDVNLENNANEEVEVNA